MATSFKATVKELEKFGLKITKIDDQNLAIEFEGKNNIRVFYPMTNNQIKFYYNTQRFIVTDAHNIPNANRIVEIEFDSSADQNKRDNLVKGKVQHTQFNTIKTCINSNIPVYLCGEAGTGKNYTLMEVAKDLNLEFYFTNSVQQEYKLTGFIDAGGTYHETEFYKAFTKGGLFFLDEIDASIPEVLVLLNAAIANKYFEFPNGRVNAHPDFRVVAAGNTVGSGADEMYTGRLSLDQATLDRFVIIDFDYDRNVELSLAKGNTELVNFVRQLRKSAKDQGIRATFSYRCIISVTSLEAAGMDIKTILKIAVFKGMNQDTIRTLKLDINDGKSGKYYYAMSDIQKEVV